MGLPWSVNFQVVQSCALVLCLSCSATALLLGSVEEVDCFSRTQQSGTEVAVNSLGDSEAFRQSPGYTG